MLVELHVRDLGVIESVRLELGPGMTALTGETGAGKTLLVEAIELLLGGRADSALVRPGAEEALVEGRFVVGDEEVILARAVPARGRSRGWIDGRMAPVSALAETGARLVDLHGQHAQQSLLDASSQRRALDAFGGVDTGPLDAALARCRALGEELEALGGDERARARDADLLRYQLAEIDGAALAGDDEDDELGTEEERLAEAGAHRQAAALALGLLDGGEATATGVVDLAGAARAALGAEGPLAALSARLGALQADAADIATELRAVVETWEDDPERLAQVRARRQLLRDLSRKYGEGPAGVRSYAEEARRRLAGLEAAEERAVALGEELAAADAARADAARAVGAARRAAAPALAAAVQARLRDLAMPRARLEVHVGEADPGDDVRFLLGANPGEPVLPLSKVASGGELARAMLALRLVLTDAPPTMVFDEVDAGVGGVAAGAVGRALAEVARRHQVLVVTHLPQVAACAGRQHGVHKEVAKGRTVARADALEGDDRVEELARMLSGSPGSTTARRHARELLGDHALHR
ncbi:MAG TPA: DNA repair protein RecN [Acidimicrobiales bacterium]|nr:DNA repair protein RecN [Acidimicrobiales bacterium]